VPAVWVAAGRAPAGRAPAAGVAAAGVAVAAAWVTPGDPAAQPTRAVPAITAMAIAGTARDLMRTTVGRTPPRAHWSAAPTAFSSDFGPPRMKTDEIRRRPR
jgi:hypothetical protein